MRKILISVVACLAIGIAASLFLPAPRAWAQQNLGIPDGLVKFTTTQGSTTGTKVASDFVTGRVTLVAGVGVVTTTKATSTANIFVHSQVAAGTVGVTHIVTRSAGVSFTVTSKAADGTTTATSDTSIIGYTLVEP